MIIDLIKDAILENAGPLKDASKGWRKQNCRLCYTMGHGRDSKSRFGIHFDADVIVLHCFNCGFSAVYTEGEYLSTSFKTFLNHLNLDSKFIKYIEFEIFKLKYNIQQEKKDSPVVIVKNLFSKWTSVKLPQDSMPISTWLDHGLDDIDFLNVVEYAVSRKLYDFNFYHWTPNKFFNLNNRLIIPYTYNKRIVGYTARLCYDQKDKRIPKYYQNCPEDFVFNLDNQKENDRKYVIVTEGVLDALVVDGVGILGEINQNKVDIINRLGRNVIVCPDGDRKGGDLVKTALNNNWAVSFPKWNNEFKDAAAAAVKYGRLLTLYSIVTSAIYNKDKIYLKWTLDQNGRDRKYK